MTSIVFPAKAVPLQEYNSYRVGRIFSAQVMDVSQKYKEKQKAKSGRQKACA
jgi:hypothetical protein